MGWLPIFGGKKVCYTVGIGTGKDVFYKINTGKPGFNSESGQTKDFKIR